LRGKRLTTGTVPGAEVFRGPNAHAVLDATLGYWIPPFGVLATFKRVICCCRLSSPEALLRVTSWSGMTRHVSEITCVDEDVKPTHSLTHSPRPQTVDPPPRHPRPTTMRIVHLGMNGTIPIVPLPRQHADHRLLRDRCPDRMPPNDVIVSHCTVSKTSEQLSLLAKKMKIGYHLTKLWARILYSVFFTHEVQYNLQGGEIKTTPPFNFASSNWTRL